MNDWVLMACPCCGGEIKIDANVVDKDFTVVGETYVYLGASSPIMTVSCEHCGQQFYKGAQTFTVQQTAFNQTGQKVYGSQLNVTIGAGGKNVAIGSFVKQVINK